MAKGMSPARMMELVPIQAVPFETLETGRVVLLRPKFLSPRFQWLQRLLSRPVFRVRLDETGSFIWGQLDGLRTVQAVCATVRERFGPAAEPVEERTLAFLHQMADGCFVSLMVKSDR